MNKPKKYIEIQYSKNFYIDYPCPRISFQFFVDWVKGHTKKGYDITISIDENFQWDENDGNIFAAYPSIIIGWKQKVKNKKYQKQLAKWKKQNVKSKNED